MVARPWSPSSLSCGERLLLRCDENTGNSFPTTQGKDPSSQARRRKRGSSGCGRDSRASSRVETGMSGSSLSCSKGVFRIRWNFQRLGVISLEKPQRKWASSRLEGRTSWIFSSCGRCLRRRPQRPALVASGKSSPHASCSGASRDSSPVDAGAKDLVWSQCWNLRIPLQC